VSRTSDYRFKSRKWVREPSSCTRVVVVAIGLSSDHVDLIHHGFSCFDNIALMHVDAADAGFLVGLQAPECDYFLVIAGELDKRFLHDLSMRKTSIYQIAEGARAERSVIDAVEQVKRLARVSSSQRLEIDAPGFASLASTC
jgi:hypothetical protein